MRAVDTVRLLAADAVQKVGNGHPGTAMSLAPLAYLLFQQVMRHDAAPERQATDLWSTTPASVEALPRTADNLPCVRLRVAYPICWDLGVLTMIARLR